jgi:hypothetical protein
MTGPSAVAGPHTRGIIEQMSGGFRQFGRHAVSQDVEAEWRQLAVESTPVSPR